MNGKSKVGSNADKGESDWKEYQEFIRLWSVGNLDENNPVYRKVENWSLKICESYKRSGEMMDVCHTCLVALGRGRYIKGHSFDAYIGSIIKDEVISMWRSTVVINTTAWAANEPERRASRIIKEVARRMNSETNMRRMMTSRPELQLDVVDVILACNTAASPDKAVKDLKPGKNPGRRIVISTYGRIKGLFGKNR